ncbi:carbohydrate-binding module family 20 domain-containing protein [Paenibacillus sp. B01]|uniref:carbohydrate-binding module family 20 domain-containing protein n=1 Tax=Paenibacillus sp. B01 TaxID=2660554 RepID=UPI00129AF6D4|nr:carbohydrate-binding module family 20 domain-containing protein [Paenibacillus sp. B01]QGG57929.1 starch-binding protein [Paenibacillus sp. B01]
MFNKLKSRWGIALAGALLLQTIAGAGLAPGSPSGLAAGTAAAAAQEYGLPADAKDGVIFHAWNWSFDNIKAQLPAIAAAGFKSIQTSPIQGNKEPLKEGSQWWVLYQPTNFAIGNAQLGNREQFRQLCAEAEKYGIDIIVDVVANHTGNAGGGSLTYTPATNVDPDIRNNASYWHEARGVDNWNDRWQVTQWGIGLPDLNTGSQGLQDKVIAFLNDAVALGADGFRFDAAKHIELPGDPGGSNFWPRVLGSLSSRQELFVYGEVLQGGADNFAGYADYMSLTASSYGHEVRRAVGFGGSPNVALAQPFQAGSVNPSKLVTWVESHDTYANDSSESTGMTDYQLKMGWALIAARAQTTSLFFDRPAGSGKFGSPLGQPGRGLWRDGDVAAVNKFHNAMAGQGEYLRTQGSQTMLVERGAKGVVIVNLGGEIRIDSPTNLASGTYANRASGGGSFTVSGGRITGTLGGGKIAVLYQDAAPSPSPTAAPSATPSPSATPNPTAAPSPTPSATPVPTPTPAAGIVVHFYKPSGWGTPSVYYYDDSVSPVRTGPAWPGTAMSDEGDGWYRYAIPSWSQAKVIFSSNGAQQPAAQQPGYAVSGREAWIKDGAVSAAKPEQGLVQVTFTIQNAATVMGQNVFIAGSIAELGGWDPAKAVGPGSAAAYPTWTVTAKLPAGANIEFKAIKKDGSGAVVWESGSNRTYTVSASNPNVTFSFRP